MATLTEIFDFETQIEPVIVSVLGTLGVSSSRSSETKSTPHVSVQLRMGAPDSPNHLHKLNDGTRIPDVWNATLSLTIATERSDPTGALHGRMVAGARVAMLQALGMFNSDNLPLHALTVITAQGTQPRIENEFDLDLTELTYSLVVTVRSSAWD